MTTQNTAERFRDAITQGNLDHYEALKMAYFTPNIHPKPDKESKDVFTFKYDDKSLLVITLGAASPKAFADGEY